MTFSSLGKPVGISGIVKNYGALRALDDVTLDVGAGEFCSLLGASGSGKTTLLKVIAGFEAIDAGHLRIGDRDIGRVPVSKRNIGMVFQNYALFPHMSVFDNVAFGLETRQTPRAELRERVDETLAMVGLTGYEERLPRQLSGGQQQRVALARALVIRPDILLMDEPLGALDKNLKQSIQLQLKALHRRVGITVIYVTHDQEEALNLSDRIVVMDAGRVIQVGTPQDLYFKPVNRFVAGFLGDCNVFPREDGSCHVVRPEHLKVGSLAQHCEIRLDTTLTDVIFIGTGLRLIMSSGGETVMAIADMRQQPEIPPPGDKICIGYRLEDVLPVTV